MLGCNGESKEMPVGDCTMRVQHQSYEDNSTPLCAEEACYQQAIVLAMVLFVVEEEEESDEHCQLELRELGSYSLVDHFLGALREPRQLKP